MPAIRFKKPKRIIILGSTAKASALAYVVAKNALTHPHLDERITMFVQEENINGQRLSRIIKKTHENPKYLPGFKLPKNIKPTTNLEKSASEADIIIIDLPFEVIKILCNKLYGKIKPTAYALIMTKGIKLAEDEGIDRNSILICKQLRIPASIFSGAVAPFDLYQKIKFMEATLGCRDSKAAVIFKSILETEFFHVSVVDDVTTVECCTTLKTIVALPRGFGLNMGHPQIAALLRIGLIEIMKFVDLFFPGGKLCTFFENCGAPALFLLCYDTTELKLIEDFMALKPEERQEKPVWERPIGVKVAAEVNNILTYKRAADRFPLFTTIHKICTGEYQANKLIECFRNYSQDIWVPKRIAYQ